VEAINLMKKLGLKGGYLNFLITILFFTLLTQSCKVKQSKNNVEYKQFNEISFIDSISKRVIPFNSIILENAIIRIEHDGHLRSLKTELVSKIDSFLQISVFTKLGIEVAKLIAFNDYILLIDNPEKSIYKADYEELSNKLGINLTYNDIIKLIFGYPYKISTENKISCNKTISYNQNSMVKIEFMQKEKLDTLETTFFYINEFDLPKGLLVNAIIKNKSNEDLFTAYYNKREDHNKYLPQRINLKFLYESKEIELDFELKKLLFDNKVFFSIDSTFIHKSL